MEDEVEFLSGSTIWVADADLVWAPAVVLKPHRPGDHFLHVQLANTGQYQQHSPYQKSSAPSSTSRLVDLRKEEVFLRNEQSHEVHTSASSSSSTVVQPPHQSSPAPHHSPAAAAGPAGSIVKEKMLVPTYSAKRSGLGIKVRGQKRTITDIRVAAAALSPSVSSPSTGASPPASGGTGLCPSPTPGKSKIHKLSTYHGTPSPPPLLQNNSISGKLNTRATPNSITRKSPTMMKTPQRRSVTGGGSSGSSSRVLSSSGTTGISSAAAAAAARNKENTPTRSPGLNNANAIVPPPPPSSLQKHHKTSPSWAAAAAATRKRNQELYGGNHVLKQTNGNAPVSKGGAGSLTEPHDAASPIAHQQHSVVLTTTKSGSTPNSRTSRRKNPKQEWDDDLCHLICLHEPAILHSLQERFYRDTIYTATGPILIAVNPFKTLHGLYELSSWEDHGRRPHVFTTANVAYEQLCQTEKSQTILISGESGAGKTESTKFVMRFLAEKGHHVQQDGKKDNTPSSTTLCKKMNENDVERAVLQSNPLLEAFGNAKTLRNHNSSRFGKFIELQFEDVDVSVAEEAGGGVPPTKKGAQKTLVGARIQTYLLEKIRVTDQQDGERSFHIFYQLRAAAAAAAKTIAVETAKNGRNDIESEIAIAAENQEKDVALFTSIIEQTDADPSQEPKSKSASTVEEPSGTCSGLAGGREPNDKQPEDAHPDPESCTTSAAEATARTSTSDEVEKAAPELPAATAASTGGTEAANAQDQDAQITAIVTNPSSPSHTMVVNGVQVGTSAATSSTAPFVLPNCHQDNKESTQQTQTAPACGASSNNSNTPSWLDLSLFCPAAYGFGRTAPSGSSESAAGSGPAAITTSTTSTSSPPSSDAEGFAETVAAMAAVGMDDSARNKTMFEILAAVMHLSRLEFEVISKPGGGVNTVSGGGATASSSSPPEKAGKPRRSSTSSTSRPGSGSKAALAGAEASVDVENNSQHTTSDQQPTARSSQHEIDLVRIKEQCQPELQLIQKLLGVDNLEEVLCHKSIECRGELVKSHLRLAQVRDNRDAIARHLYGLIFNDLVSQANRKCAAVGAGSGDFRNGDDINFSSARSSVQAKQRELLQHDSSSLRHNYNNSSTSGGGRNKHYPFCGVLDIFGFECFRRNSFEQLCINYANERLQQFFNNFVFLLEETLYRKENVVWHPLNFPDNSLSVELLQEKHTGILSVLDEECIIVAGTDQAFVNKLVKLHNNKNEKFEAVKLDRAAFQVKHFAGSVKYHSDKFLDKNKDQLSADVLASMKTSKNDYLSQLFKADPKYQEHIPGRKRKTRTIGAEFQSQLQQLLEKIETTDPHFIRCIKSNPGNRPGLFDRKLVTEQLRYSGVIQVVQISRSGYPVRILHRDLWADYRCVVPFLQRNPELLAAPGVVAKRSCTSNGATVHQGQLLRKMTTRLLELMSASCKIPFKDPLHPQTASFQIGKTLVFFKKAAFAKLHQARLARRSTAATQVQAFFRMAVVKLRFLRTKWKLVRIQAVFRGFAARRRYAIALKRYRAARTIQAIVRMTIVRGAYLYLIKKSAPLIQRCVRGMLARNRARKLWKEKYRKPILAATGSSSTSSGAHQKQFHRSTTLTTTPFRASHSILRAKVSLRPSAMVSSSIAGFRASAPPGTNTSSPAEPMIRAGQRAVREMRTSVETILSEQMAQTSTTPVMGSSSTGPLVNRSSPKPRALSITRSFVPHPARGGAARVSAGPPPQSTSSSSTAVVVESPFTMARNARRCTTTTPTGATRPLQNGLVPLPRTPGVGGGAAVVKIGGSSGTCTSASGVVVQPGGVSTSSAAGTAHGNGIAVQNTGVYQNNGTTTTTTQLLTPSKITMVNAGTTTAAASVATISAEGTDKLSARGDPRGQLPSSRQELLHSDHTTTTLAANSSSKNLANTVTLQSPEVGYRPLQSASMVSLGPATQGAAGRVSASGGDTSSTTTGFNIAGAAAPTSSATAANAGTTTGFGVTTRMQARNNFFNPLSRGSGVQRAGRVQLPKCSTSQPQVVVSTTEEGSEGRK
ncbi:unnamed protein product [Amoebophrya sp. A120]|nr:unnamed protein product [Amoebophrya sp. A120]|eukprot:GSA120T00023589001.1